MEGPWGRVFLEAVKSFLSEVSWLSPFQPLFRGQKKNNSFSFQRCPWSTGLLRGSSRQLVKLCSHWFYTQMGKPLADLA